MLKEAPIGLVPLNWKYSPANLDSYLEGIAAYGFEGIQISLEQGNSQKFNRKMNALKLRNAEHYIAIRCNQDGPLDGFMDEYLGQVEFAGRNKVEMLVLAVDGSLDREKVAGRVDASHSMTIDGVQKLANLLNQIAAEALKLGVKSSFHPHAATYIETPSETQSLFEYLDETLVSMCLDVGHWIVGGGNPVEAVREFGPRITHVHVKDVDGEVLQRMVQGEFETMEDAVVEAKLFVPAGTGLLDLPGFLSALDSIGFSAWLMSEQDSAHEPSEAASGVSMENIQKAIK